MLWLALAIGVVATGLALVLVAYGPRMGYTLRDPTEAEDERLRSLREDVGTPGVEVAVRTTNRDDLVQCDLVGLPGRRMLVVSNAALELLDDEQLRALLAVEAERGRSRIEVLQALATGAAVGVVAAAYVTSLPFLPVMAGGWAIVLIAIALVRRRHYAADATAGERVGRGTLRDAIERAAELRGESLDSDRGWRALFDDEPAIGDRLERLRDGAER